MKYIISLDGIPDEATQYMQRALVIFPKEDLLNVEQKTPVILINRSCCQSYFVLDLHDRYHCDVGVNGVKMLIEFMQEKQINYLFVSNTEKKFISQRLSLIVMNQNENNSKDSKDAQYMNKIRKFFNDLPSKCPTTMKMAIENSVDKRGTFSVHYGFTMSKCTDIIPKNALYDYNIPTHCSSITDKNEVQWVLLNINTLLLHFEKITSQDGKSFGVTNNNWFDDDNNSLVSKYKHFFAREMGINSASIDWRLYGVSLL